MEANRTEREITTVAKKTTHVSATLWRQDNFCHFATTLVELDICKTPENNLVRHFCPHCEINLTILVLFRNSNRRGGKLIEPVSAGRASKVDWKKVGERKWQAAGRSTKEWQSHWSFALEL